MKDLTIRRAVPEDSPAIIEFQVEMALETEGIVLDEDVIHHGVKAVFDDPARGFYQVAEMNGNIIACHLVTLEWSDWRNAVVYWIQSLYVVPEYREQGVFRTMYLRLKEQAQTDRSVGGIRLYVDKRNRRAREVYLKMGMDDNHYDLFEWMKV